MPELGPRRISGESSGGRQARRGPGIAVVAVAAYGLAFLAALWILQRQSPLFSRARPEGPGGGSLDAPPAPPPARGALLAGEGLAIDPRGRYLERLGADRCDCGCDLTLKRCLETDEKCVRSPELARRRFVAAAAPGGPPARVTAAAAKR